MTTHNKGISLSLTDARLDGIPEKTWNVTLQIYRFFNDVYPDFYAKSWLGEGKHNKHVDNFIDNVIVRIRIGESRK